MNNLLHFPTPTPSAKLAKLVILENDAYTVRNVPVDGLEAAGFTITGHTPDNGRTRPELWNQPKLAGFNGPMWDGDRIRYESTAAYAALSV